MNLEETHQRIAALELEITELGRLLSHRPEIPLVDAGAAPRPIMCIIRTVDGASMNAQEIKYSDDPPIEGRIEPVGTTFPAYPMPGMEYDWYVAMGFVYPGNDWDPVGSDAFTFQAWPNEDGHRILYPDPRLESSPIEDFGPRQG